MRTQYNWYGSQSYNRSGHVQEWITRKPNYCVCVRSGIFSFYIRNYNRNFDTISHHIYLNTIGLKPAIYQEDKNKTVVRPSVRQLDLCSSGISVITDCRNWHFIIAIICAVGWRVGQDVDIVSYKHILVKVRLGIADSRYII